MGFYDLPKPERQKLANKIFEDIIGDLSTNSTERILDYFSDGDTYIRKAGYQTIGKTYAAHEDLRLPIFELLNNLVGSKSAKVRQTTINAAGEIGMKDFKIVAHLFDRALFDEHHSVRNAVIGSIKKMGAKNPEHTLAWAKKYLHHPDKEIRREICHGLELRGRTHPQDILPMLAELQFDTTARVRNTLVHVLGQISYKKGCLPTIVATLKKWENKTLVEKALNEIVDVHKRYANFAFLTQKEAIAYIDQQFSQV